MKNHAALVPMLTGIALVLGVVSADAAGGARLTRVYYDSPGADTGSNTSVNAEWFTLTNHGTVRRSLSGHVYRFPTGYHLGAGKTVKVHTGNGSSTHLNRYWGQDYYVWNNSGDKAILKNRAGSKVDTCSWSGLGTGQTAC